jgi:hypothetical protein
MEVGDWNPEMFSANRPTECKFKVSQADTNSDMDDWQIQNYSSTQSFSWASASFWWLLRCPSTSFTDNDVNISGTA